MRHYPGKSALRQRQRQQGKEKPAAAEKRAQRQPNTEDNDGKKLNQRRLRLGQDTYTDQQGGKDQQEAPGQREPVENGEDFSIDLDQGAALPLVQIFRDRNRRLLPSHLAAMAYGQYRFAGWKNYIESAVPRDRCRWCHGLFLPFIKLLGSFTTFKALRSDDRAPEQIRAKTTSAM